MHTIILRIGLVSSLVFLTTGCGREEPPTASRPPTGQTKPADEARTYVLKGVVREIDAPTGVVTIAHEEIPGFMKAMTMDFTPKDRSNLKDVHVGDEVEGPLQVLKKNGTVANYDLLSLAVTKPAPMVLTFDPGSGTASLTAKPAILNPGEIVPDFAMTTQDGKPLKLSDLRGKVVVLTFIYTRCPLPDYCPAVDKKFRELAERIAAVKGRADRVRLVSISFDPEHDTAETLRKHAELQGAKPPIWTFAVASHEELRKIVERLGLIYGPMPNEIRHNLCTAVIDSEGKLVRLDVGAAGKSWTSADMIKTILSQVGAFQR